MMKRMAVLVSVLLLALGTMAAPAAADGPPWQAHGHVLLLGADLEENPAYPDEGPPYFVVGFERCVDLAGGQALHLGAHHTRVHTGTANMKLATKAGHYVQPTGGLSHIGIELPGDCAGYEQALAR